MMSYKSHTTQRNRVLSNQQVSHNTDRDLVLPIVIQPPLTQTANHTTDQIHCPNPACNMNRQQSIKPSSILRNMSHLTHSMPNIDMSKHHHKDSGIPINNQIDYTCYGGTGSHGIDLSITTRMMNVQKKTQNGQELEQNQVIMQHVSNNNNTPIPAKQGENEYQNISLHDNNQNNNHNGHNNNNNSNLSQQQQQQQLSSQELNKLQIVRLQEELTLCDQLYAQVQKALLQSVATKQQIPPQQITIVSPPGENETVFFTQNLYTIVDQVLRDGQEQAVICKNTPTGRRGHKLRSRLVINVATACHIKQNGLLIAYNQDVFPVSSEDLWIELRILRSRQDSLMLQLMHLNAAASLAQVTHCDVKPAQK